MIAFLCLPISAMAIGQITQLIEIKNVLRGQEIQEILTLFNSENNEVEFTLEDEGDIDGWAKFYSMDDSKNPIEKIKAPAKGRIQAIVKLTIPEDVANGTYSGMINVLNKPKQSEDSNKKTTVAQKVSRRVLIEVSDQEIIECKAFVIPVSYSVGQGEPLKIKIVYNNRGNVKIKPNAQLKISFNGEQIHNAIYPYPENEEAVKPLSQKEIFVEWSANDLEKGKHNAQVDILLNGKIIQEESFGFNVGSGKVLGASYFEKTGAKVAVAVIILAIGIAFVIIKKKDF